MTPREKALEAALQPLLAMFDDYQDSKLSHADAHNAFVGWRAKYDAWHAARAALAMPSEPEPRLTEAEDRIFGLLHNDDGQDSKEARRYLATYRPDLKARLDTLAMPSEPTWQPIETAPKDREVLVYNEVTGIYITKADHGEWPRDGWGGMAGTWYPQPTHWMPLPKPPKETT